MLTNSPSPPTPTTLSEAVENTLEAGLVEYLKDIGWTSALVDWLHEETGISKGRLKLAVRLFAMLVSKAAVWTASGTGRMAARVSTWLFSRIPGSEQITKALAKLDRTKAAEVELAAVHAGRLAPRDAKLTEHLSPSSRAQFTTQAWLHRIAERLDPQPSLDLSYLPPDTDAKRFVYTSRSVKLLGRDREMAALRAFLDADTPFAWWIVEGPGGVGKSRLALEFALHSGGPWRIGFLRTPRHFGWREWRPTVPTAMVVDYANEMAEELGDTVRDLVTRARQGEFAQPVRLLLLARESEGTWKSQFLGAGARRAAIETACYGNPLSISPLDDDALWEVLRSVVPAGVLLPDQEETIASLVSTDPQRRPLFALFAGDAIRHGRDIQQWDTDALVDDVLEREKEHWRKAGVTEKDKNLLALATITAKLDTERISDLDPSLFPSVEGGTSSNSFDPLRYQVMVGASAERVLAPLLPDILGELFVLDHLKPRYAGDVQRADILRRTAWDIGSEGIHSFLTRAAVDFPQSETLPLLDLPPLHTDLEHRSLWGVAAANLILMYGNVGRLEHSWRLYREFCALSKTQPGVIARILALALFNLLTVNRKAGHEIEVRALYEELRALTAVNLENEVVRELRAKAAVTMQSSLRYDPENENVMVEARELYEEVRRLSDTLPTDGMGRELTAMATINLMSLLLDDNDRSAERVEDAWQLYKELRVLSEASAGDRWVRQIRARAALNLLAGYGRIGRVNRAMVVYKELCVLFALDVEDDAISEWWEHATSNLLNLISADHVDDQRRVYDVLRALAEVHTQKEPILNHWIIAATNIVFSYVEAKRADEAWEVYNGLRALSEANVNLIAFQVARALAAFNLLALYVTEGQADEAWTLHDDLQTLSTLYSEVPTITSAFRNVTARVQFRKDSGESQRN